MLIPALILCSVGSLLPSNLGMGGGSIIDANDDDGDGLRSLFLVQKSIVDAFSPYTSSSLELVSLLPPPTPATTPFTSSIKIRQSSSFLPNFDLPYLLRLVVLTIISPVTLDIVFHHFAPIILQVFARVKFVLSSRKDPDASANTALMQRVRIRRAIRRHAYDLYLPPKSSNVATTAASSTAANKKLDDRSSSSSHNSNSRNNTIIKIKSLLFFPGFGIHHAAYADVASKISDCGIPVMVVSLEPFRLAHGALGGGMEHVIRWITSAGKEVVADYSENNREYNEKKNSIDNRGEKMNGNVIVEWALGGHSMGGYNALQLAEELLLLLQTETKNNPPSIVLRDGSITRVGSQIVAWAAGTAVENVPNLLLTEANVTSPSPSSSAIYPLRVLLLLASNDKIAKFASHEQKRQLLSNKLPKASRLETIQGGNHAGFGSYDTANKSDGLDGPRSISLEAQHEEASKRTVRFLLDEK